MDTLEFSQTKIVIKKIGKFFLLVKKSIFFVLRSDEECLIEQNGTGLGAVSAALVGFLGE